MSVKNILLLSATSLSVITTPFVFADNNNASFQPAIIGIYPPAQTEMTPISHSDGGNICYIEGNAGYARQNYFDSSQWIANTGIERNENGQTQGGFAGGVDFGYQINHYLAIELGWFDLPSVNSNASAALSGYTGAYMTSWAAYFAVKYIVALPSIQHTDVFFKLGAAYRTVHIPNGAVVWSTGTIAAQHFDYVRPMFATGVDYNFTPHLVGILQYAFFMGASNAFGLQNAANLGALGIVPANVFTFGLGYQFNV